LNVLVRGFTSLIPLLTGPAGLIILLGGALFAARKLFDQNQEEYLKLAKEKKENGSLSKKDEDRLKELETPVNREKARQDLKYDPTTGKTVSDEELKKSKDQVNKDTQASYKRIENDAFIQLANEFEASGKKDPLLNPENRENVTRRTKELIAQGYVPKPMPSDVKVEGSGAPSVLPNQTAGGAAVLYPTPGMQKTPGLNHGGRTTQKLVGGGVDDERLRPNTPTVAPYSNEGKTRPTPTPSQVAAPSGDYNSKIGGRESGGNYDTIFGKAGGATINGKLVTENTIGEVAAWQADEKSRKTNKQAAGKYQFMDVNAAAQKAGLGPNDLFNAENQDKMMAAYTAENAKQLRAYGLPDTEEYLSMAHAVGAKGAKQLIDAQNAGMGDANSLDVLGLKGAAAKTNPQLNTNVDTTIAALKGGGPMGHGGDTMLAKNKSLSIDGKTLPKESPKDPLADTLGDMLSRMAVLATQSNKTNQDPVNISSGGSSGGISSSYDNELIQTLIGLQSVST
jgi:hypothetical protein